MEREFICNGANTAVVDQTKIIDPFLLASERSKMSFHRFSLCFCGRRRSFDSLNPNVPTCRKNRSSL